MAFTRSAQAFRALVESNGAEVCDIPAGTFAEIGTQVATTMAAFTGR
jgi:hypothetical protein